ncbi:hypothetical protein AMTR_s00162p00034800 [Amborella trichopoda]|uniref:Major facilitator superfamily (MFS) profile domain-containing protein n=1 Tax=Amborella trichopoda TaxID=13333 RepID=W1PMR5_AMBTC|nr:hypothetical protein AMTR_s00162p00034800 [Amborella trichopoda]
MVKEQGLATKMSEEVEGKVDWKGRPAAMEKHGGFSPAMFILASFAFENLATLALAVNLVTYFNAVMHFGLAEAANSVTNYMGTGYLLSVLVACIADAYVGRFRTVLITGCIELLVCSLKIHLFVSIIFVLR